MSDAAPVSSRRMAGAAAAAAAALERSSDGVGTEFAVLQAELAAQGAEIERLHEVCAERQAVIEELRGYGETYRRAAEERAGMVAALELDVRLLREALERAERERSEERASAETAAHAMDDERARATMTLHEREAQLHAAHREAESLRTRVEGLLGALAARGALVDELQTACEERLATIEQMRAEVVSLRLVAEERRILLESNEAAYRARAEIAQAQSGGGADAVDWRAHAEERLRLLEEVSAEAERRTVLLAELTAALERRTREVEDLRKRVTQAS
jgi:chromosome segregation ATPase